MPQLTEAHRPALKIHIPSGKILSIHINPRNFKIYLVAEMSPLLFCLENFSFIALLHSVLAHVPLLPCLPGWN